MPILKFEIPAPADPELKARYIALGWYELPPLFDGQARLKWSYGRGAPLHPVDDIDGLGDPRITAKPLKTNS